MNVKLRAAAQWAEIAASLAVVVTLVILVRQVRANTLALERQVTLDRATAFAAPFLESSELPLILARIKEVDGPDPLPEALVQQYGLTYAEATTWERHLWLLWSGLEATFLLQGPTEELDVLVGALKGTPDNQTYIRYGLFRHSPSFAEYVEQASPASFPGQVSRSP